MASAQRRFSKFPARQLYVWRGLCFKDLLHAWTCWEGVDALSPLFEISRSILASFSTFASDTNEPLHYHLSDDGVSQLDLISHSFLKVPKPASHLPRLRRPCRIQYFTLFSMHNVNKKPTADQQGAIALFSYGEGKCKPRTART
jgi:hypothetical protein